ncbi:uncharacterized protein [Ciconia boyciana]|uniref:uncharacterized protein isoform X5 n=1 Tax=Ciconia boyciana TaxID=52775 RepID=UPI003B9E1212
MEAAGGSQMGFSPSWRRDELRRLRRLRRRWSSDPLLARLRPGDRSPRARRSAEPVLKGKRLLGTAATDRRREVREDICLHLSFWKRIAGIIIAVAVILLLMWITLNPPKLPQLEPCPDDWLYYKKKCYYHSRAMADWNSSQEFCSAYGASLAVVDSHQELAKTGCVYLMLGPTVLKIPGSCRLYNVSNTHNRLLDWAAQERKQILLGEWRVI